MNWQEGLAIFNQYQSAPHSHLHKAVLIDWCEENNQPIKLAWIKEEGELPIRHNGSGSGYGRGYGRGSGDGDGDGSETKQYLFGEEMPTEIGTPVILRCDQSGMIFGYFAGQSGRVVDLENSRKIWRWDGTERLECHDLAVVVEDNNQLSRIVPGISTFFTACEIHPCTPEVEQYYLHAKAKLEN